MGTGDIRFLLKDLRNILNEDDEDRRSKKTREVIALLQETLEV